MRNSHFLRIFQTSILLALLALSICVKAQIPGSRPPDSSTIQTPLMCGSDPEYFTRGGGAYAGISATSFPSYAIFTCGLIDVYYADVAGNFGIGFDDTTAVGSTTIGAQRRATMCAVLSYIQSVFDFSNIDSSNHIRIFVDTSFNPVNFHVPRLTTFYARAFPQYDSTVSGIKKGWMNDYITSPTWYHHDSISNDEFHGTIQLNFDITYPFGMTSDTPAVNWHNDYSAPFVTSTSCEQIPLYSVLLHEICHCMGWFSLITFNGTGTMGLTPYPSLSNPHIFSMLDWSFTVGANTYPLSLTKVLSGTGDMPVLDTSNPLFYCNNNYWLNDSAAPKNVPVYSGGFGNGLTHSYLSHTDDQEVAYTTRGRISPGDEQEYLMGPFNSLGVYHTTYSKGELQGLVDILGYRLTPSFTAANPYIYPHHLPFSVKMAKDSITSGNYAYFTETVKPDDTLTNNTGASDSISIPAMIDSGYITDADASELDSIYIDSTTLVNFRGCGTGGNNHLLLHVSGDSKHITYTPRANFYGRATYGFNLTDGHERGSFVVINTDVYKGNNVSCATGANMICNPGFEDGSEIKIYATDELIPNATVTETQLHEGKWQGICYSDSHPYCFHSNIYGFQLGPTSGSVVENSDYACGVVDSLNPSETGTEWTSCPERVIGSSLDNPSPDDSGGYRYQLFSAPGGSYYNLLDSARNCTRYKLEFDLYREVGALFTNLPLKIGFANNTVDLQTTDPTSSLNFEFNDTLSNDTTRAWIHFTIPFVYCGTNPSNILLLLSGSVNIEAQFDIDNLSLKQDTTPPPPLIISIAQTGIGGCLTQLNALVTNPFCDVSYSWSSTEKTTLTANSDTVRSDSAATYTVSVSDGCRDSTASTTIRDTLPRPIDGPDNVCPGSTVTLTDSVMGGTWSSSDTGIATINISSGIVTGISTGYVIITYSTYCTNIVTYTVTVNPLPAGITGASGVCSGGTTLLSDLTSGGTWSSSDTDATIGASTGLVTGIATGTAEITYTIATGCIITRVITVNPSPPSITGYPVVCVDSTTDLSDSLGGGTWLSGNTSIATVGSLTGIVTGVGIGTTNISYITPCGDTLTIELIVPYPGPITGSFSMCLESGGTTLSDSAPGGTWSSSNVSVAIVSTVTATTGFVGVVSAGTAIITYTTHCGDFVTATVTVAPLPITGSTFICTGATTTLTDASPGGTWSTSTLDIAPVNSTTGKVTGLSPGTAIITYTTSGGCTTTFPIYINIPAPITGSTNVCSGSTITLSDADTGGTWSSGNLSVAHITPGTGIVTGISSGTVTITYTDICGGYATIVITVSPSPSAITGTTELCYDGTYTGFLLSDSVAGGTWSSSNPDIAPIYSSDGDIGVSAAGIAIITYTLCDAFQTTTVTVFAQPGPIGGNAQVCQGSSTTLTDTVSGGTWSSSNAAVATIGSTTGAMTGITVGTATITYTIGICTTVTTVTVIPSPAVITGTTSICDGTTSTLSDATYGGTWSSSSTSIVSIVSGTGVATGAAAGTAIITYIISDGCIAIVTFTVEPQPATITGTTYVCAGSTTTLSDGTTGGTWNSNNTVIATVSAGIVTGVSAGTVVISYTMPGGCYATTIVTVNPLPTQYTITGGGSYCAGVAGVDIGLDGSLSGITYKLYDGSTLMETLSGAGSALDFGLETSSGTYIVIATNTTTDCTDTMSGSVGVTVVPLPDAITGNPSLCPGGTTTLSDGTTGGVWRSGSTGIATVSGIGVVTAVASGTAVISYTHIGCVATFVVMVYPDSGGTCTPCSYYGTSAFTTLGATISANLNPGNYYEPSSVTVYGTDTFTDAIIMMAAGDTMAIDTSAFLTLDSSHIFSCSMWEGMALLPGTTTSGRLILTRSTLIEDAMTAVYAPYPITPSSGNVFVSDNAIFNRNMVGVDIEHYSSLSASYPFLVRNTVITGRNFTGYRHYPSAWPGTDTLKAYYTDTNIFDPPFHIQTYTGANCKNGQPPYIGILIDSVGADTSNAAVLPGVAFPSYYTDITIGDTTQTAGNKYQNLIDYQEFGIKALNSNVTCVNNAFINMYNVKAPVYMSVDTVIGGDGIYAAAVNDAVNHNRLRVWSPNGNPYHNVWYEFTNGVECYNYFHLIGQKTYMINALTGSSILSISHGPSGIYGYVVESAKYDTVDISNDTVYNANTGIAFWAMQDPAQIFAYPKPSPPWQYSGQVNITGNLIQPHPQGYAAITTQRVNMGIAVQNVLAQTSHANTDSGQVNINYNYLHDVYNGIFVNNFWRQGAISYTNTITIRPNGLSPRALQYGINYTHCSKGFVNNNYVAGTAGAAVLKDSLRGYYASSNSKLIETCNVVDSVGRGFEFFIQNPLTYWFGNTMSNNIKGFVLNGAIIGTQGTYGRGCDDQWTGLTWGGANLQTYVYNGANAINDTLYILGTSGSTYPTVNFGSPAPNAYAPSYGIASYGIGGGYAPCPETVSLPANDSTYQQMAQQAFAYDYNVIPNNWMGQFKLWEALLADSTMADSSQVFYVFDSMAQNSRFAYITNIETQIAQGNFDSAWTMLGYNIDSLADTSTDSATQVRLADGTGADYIVQNYQKFYTLYMTYIEDTLSGSDSSTIAALAGLCPERNGTVVYQARALYSAIFNDLSVFNDDSCMNADTTYIASRHSNPGGITQSNNFQVYKLFPNPNDGNMTLSQMISDAQPVDAEIFDVVGRSIYKNSLLFTNRVYNLQISNLVPGVYFLKLKDTKGREFRFKFVIE